MFYGDMKLRSDTATIRRILEAEIDKLYLNTRSFKGRPSTRFHRLAKVSEYRLLTRAALMRTLSAQGAWWNTYSAIFQGSADFEDSGLVESSAEDL